MAVSNLITPVDPSSTYPTVPAGDNRLLFLTVNVAQSSTINATAPTSVSVGGVAMTWVAGDAPGVTQLRTTMSTWMIKESQIASMSGSAITMSGESGALNRRIAWAVQGASQVTPTRIANGYVSTGAISMSLARVADSWTFFGAFTQVGEDITLTNPARTSRILNVNIGYAAGTAQTVNSTTQSKTYYQTAHVINVEPAPLQTITDINSGGDVSGDTSGNTFTTTGFTESITDVAVGTLDCTDVVESPAGSGTFTVPPPVHLSTYPEIGVNQDVEISGATESATLAKPFVLNGYTRTALVDPEIVDLTYPTAHFDVTPVTTDLMITVTADLTPSADGGITTDAPKTTIIMHWVRSTEVMYIYSFVINGGGVVSAGGLVSRGLVQTGLVQRGLVTIGL